MSAFKTFADLTLPQPLALGLDAIEFKNPTPIQTSVIPGALKGRDVLGIAPTGTGKTGAFGIPALAFLYPQPGKQVLILAPTRELAAQIFRFLRKLSDRLNVKGSLLVGGESFGRQRKECQAGVDFMVATPGRLIDHVTRGLDLGKVSMLVLDEVDRMLDMGFAPQVEQIVRALPPQRQTFLFSATMPKEIVRLADQYLKNPLKVTVEISAATKPKIQEENIQTTDAEKPQLLLEQIANREGKILIFANTQGRVEQITRRLNSSGQPASSIHAGRTNGERKYALECFRRGEVRILVATDVVSRGIDVADIEHVINYDYPQTHEDYLHRIGRTGRIGKEGKAVTFLDEKRAPRRPRAPRGRSSAPAAKHPPKRTGFQNDRRPGGFQKTDGPRPPYARDRHPGAERPRPPYARDRHPSGEGPRPAPPWARDRRPARPMEATGGPESRAPHWAKGKKEFKPSNEERNDRPRFTPAWKREKAAAHAAPAEGGGEGQKRSPYWVKRKGASEARPPWARDGRPARSSSSEGRPDRNPVPYTPKSRRAAEGTLESRKPFWERGKKLNSGPDERRDRPAPPWARGKRPSRPSAGGGDRPVPWARDGQPSPAGTGPKKSGAGFHARKAQTGYGRPRPGKPAGPRRPRPQE
jgi:ATP-dependent RNA helicase RhlE